MYFEIVVTINLPLKPSAQLVIILPVLRKLYFFIFLIYSIKDNYHINDLLDVNIDDLFLYLSHDATIVL